MTNAAPILISRIIALNAWSCMPKPPPKREPDPMSHVVDRLLAQLPGLQGASEPVSAANRSSTGIRTVVGGRQITLPTPAGLWGRMALGMLLGVMITGWPYFRECGLPLFGYLAAVAAIVLAGGWIAVISWKLRSEAAHVLALLLVLWGFVLIMDVLLPRMGYAAEAASWRCGQEGSGPTWMRWFGPLGE